MEAILEQASALAFDLDLAEVRRWKERNPGRLAIGYMPIYVPRPLIEAIGCLPVAIFGGGDQIDIIRGDSYFQSLHLSHPAEHARARARRRTSTCSTAMIFPSICDVIRNLGGHVADALPREVRRRTSICPQNFDPDARWALLRRARCGASPRDLAARGAMAARPRRAARGHRARERPARGARGARRVCARRAVARARVARRTSSSARAACSTTPSTRRFVREFLRAARERDGRVLSTTSASSFVGAFCEQPPLELIRDAREARAATSSTTTSSSGCATIEGPIDVATTSDPLDALARAFLEQGAPDGVALHRRAREGRGAHRARARDATPTASSSPPRRSAIRRCSISRCSRPRSTARASRTRASSSRRTPGSSRSFASRPARSPTPSSSGEVQRDDAHRTRRTSRAPKRRRTTASSARSR